ncbi:MAG: NUDIX domain-containing protein [Chitinophagaceae bacterium]
MNLILPAVAMIVFNDNAEILLQQRRDSGEWCILSGHIEYGETVEEAAHREILEETGCHSAILRLIGVYSAPASQTYRYPRGSVQYITTCVEARLTEGSNRIRQNEESLEIAFFPVDALPQPLAQMHPDWLKDCLNKTATAVLR